MHHGFYSAYHNTSLRPAVLDAVAEAKKLYGDLKIMVTGHSMGGAMAAFCGLDLTVIIQFFISYSSQPYLSLLDLLEVMVLNLGE